MRLKAGGYDVTFVGLANFEKQLFGSEQFHFLGTFARISPLGWAFASAVGPCCCGGWSATARPGSWLLGLIGRLITAALLLRARAAVRGDLFSGTQFGTLGVTLFYVLVGCTVQFLIGLGLADHLRAADPRRGRSSASSSSCR